MGQVRKSIGLDVQNNFRGILTDGFMSVKGVEHGSMFAIGDCATIEQVASLPFFITIIDGRFRSFINHHLRHTHRHRYKQYALGPTYPATPLLNPC